jgi:hypothetical protein
MSPQYRRIKRLRGVPVNSLSVFDDDVPIYPNHEFEHTGMEWRKERARLAGQLLRLSHLMCSVKWSSYGWTSFDGHHGHRYRHIPEIVDLDLFELNARRMMGDAAFTESEAALLNRQLNRWQSTVFRALICNANAFAFVDCPVLAIPVFTFLSVYSEDIDTDKVTVPMSSDAYDSDHMIPRRMLSYFPKDGNAVLVARFLDHVRDEVYTAAELVMLSTDQQQLRWQPIVMRAHPEYLATILLAKRRYYSRLARVFAKRLLRRQILHYQGRKPMDRQQLQPDASGDFYPPSEDFKYTLLERSLGLT